MENPAQQTANASQAYAKTAYAVTAAARQNAKHVPPAEKAAQPGWTETAQNAAHVFHARQEAAKPKQPAAQQRHFWAVKQATKGAGTAMQAIAWSTKTAHNTTAAHAIPVALADYVKQTLACLKGQQQQHWDGRL